MTTESVQSIKEKRQEQLRDQVLFSLLSQLEANNVTLVELTEFWNTKYSQRITANHLQGHRSSKRRKEINKAAVNQRWQRQYDLLKGSKTRKEKLESLGAGKTTIELPDVSDAVVMPEGEFIPAASNEQPSALDEALGVFE